MTVLGAILILVGAVFCLLAAVGMLRFPDFYTRVHAASKAGVLGTGAILLGTALASADIGAALRVLVGLAFLIVSAPVAAHLLARAARRSGTLPAPNTKIED